MKKLYAGIILGLLTPLFLVFYLVQAAPSVNLLGKYAVVNNQATTSVNANFTASGSIAFPTLGSASLCLITDANGLLSTATCGAGGSGMTSAASTTGTNFTFSTTTNTLTIQFPSFLTGLTSTGTVSSAWGLNDSAYRAAVAGNALAVASTTGTNFTVASSATAYTITFPTFLSGLTSTGTVATAWVLNDSAFRADNVTSLASSTATHFTVSGNTIYLNTILAPIDSSSTAATQLSLNDSAFRAATVDTNTGFTSFSTGTAGTVWRVSSTTNTLNLFFPNAGTASSGLLSATDWNSFTNGVNSMNGATGTVVFSTTTGTNFTFSGNQIIFPSFLSGVISTSTAKTAWGFVTDLMYHGATTSQAVDLGLNDSAYRSGAAGASQGFMAFATTTGTNFSQSSTTLTLTTFFPSFLDGFISSSTGATKMSLNDSAFRAATVDTTGFTSFATTTSGGGFTAASTTNTLTIKFPSFLDPVVSTSTAKTAWGFSNDLPYHGATSSQATDLTLGSLAYRSNYVYGVSGIQNGVQMATSSAGTNFNFSSSSQTITFNFPNYLAGIISTSTLYTAAGFANSVSYHGATTSQAADLGLNDSAYRAAGSGSVTASGTTNQFPFYTSATNLSSTSSLYYSTTNSNSYIAIATTTAPTVQFVVGATSTGSNVSIDTSTNAPTNLFDVQNVGGLSMFSISNTGSTTFISATGTSMSLTGLKQNNLVYTQANGRLQGLANASGTPTYVLTASDTAPFFWWKASASGVGGSGVANQVSIWENSVTEAGDSAFTFSSSTDILTITNVSSTAMSVSGLKRYNFPYTQENGNLVGLANASGTPTYVLTASDTVPYFWWKAPAASGGTATSSVAFSVEFPIVAEDDVIMSFDTAATLVKAIAVNKTSGDSFTWNLCSAASRQQATSTCNRLAFGSYNVTTSTTTPTSYTPATTTINAGDVLRLVGTSASSSQFNVTILYTLN